MFRKVFGEHPHLLNSFLNARLPLGPGREVVTLDYLPVELVPEASMEILLLRQVIVAGFAKSLSSKDDF